MLWIRLTKKSVNAPVNVDNVIVDVVAHANVANVNVAVVVVKFIFLGGVKASTW